MLLTPLGARTQMTRIAIQSLLFPNEQKPQKHQRGADGCQPGPARNAEQNQQQPQPNEYEARNAQKRIAGAGVAFGLHVIMFLPWQKITSRRSFYEEKREVMYQKYRFFYVPHNAQSSDEFQRNLPDRAL